MDTQSPGGRPDAMLDENGEPIQCENCRRDVVNLSDAEMVMETTHKLIGKTQKVLVFCDKACRIKFIRRKVNG